MMLYKHPKAMVPSSDGDTDFFNIVTGILQGDIWFWYLFILYHDYKLWTSIDLIKENNFPLKKVEQQRVSSKTYNRLCRWSSVSYNTPIQAESLQHNSEKVTNKHTEFMCFKEGGIISTLSCKPLKLIDQFTYLGSNISSIESDVYIWLGKEWNTIYS